MSFFPSQESQGNSDWSGELGKDFKKGGGGNSGNLSINSYNSLQKIYCSREQNVFSTEPRHISLLIEGYS